MAAPTESVLLADIGATNARFALLVQSGVAVSETYAVADHASPVDAMRAFLTGPASGHRPQRALIAAAGPVHAGRVTLTNAAWVVDPNRIAKALDMQDVRVLNDFEALGWSLPALQPGDLATVGTPRGGEQGTMAVLGPGTGFGLAALAYGRQEQIVLVTEGGHATLSSENRREDAVIVALRHQLRHVSVESVLSGPGLVDLYHAIAKTDGKSVPGRDNSDIIERALAGDCEVSRETLELFCAFLGSVAGNIALSLGASGGVFIAGGIVPRFTDFLRRSSFRERFEAKAKMSAYLARIPTAVIVHPNPAFIGLTYLATTSGRPPLGQSSW